jgi:hypothetical protein
VKSGANWFVGATATQAERALIIGSGIVGAVLVWLAFVRPESGAWSWWQQAIAVLVAADLIGGAVSNAANSTKAQYQEPLPPDASAMTRIALSPVTFAALHIYPFLVPLLYPAGSWVWAAAWYLGMLASVVVLDRLVPLYLQRPWAMAFFALAVIAALAWPAPAGWQWLPYLYVAKISLGHAVRERPFRP